jgi:pyruvate formate lyase activating enzyme
VEVTVLVVPNENDSQEEITALSKWLMAIDKDIPLHITRFFPRYKYSHLSPTPVRKIYEFVEIAKKYLNFVYAGNC